MKFELTKRSESKIKKLFVILVVTLFAAMTLTSCFDKNKNPSRSSLDAAGKVKGTYSAVAVFYPDQVNKRWQKSHERAIQSSAEVFTVKNTSTKMPKTFAVKTKGASGKDIDMDLMEVVFKNPGQQKWLKGFVLTQCFDWDVSKNIDEKTKNSASTVESEKGLSKLEKPEAKMVTGRSFCGADL